MKTEINVTDSHTGKNPFDQIEVKRVVIQKKIQVYLKRKEFLEKWLWANYNDSFVGPYLKHERELKIVNAVLLMLYRLSRKHKSIGLSNVSTLQQIAVSIDQLKVLQDKGVAGRLEIAAIRYQLYRSYICLRDRL